MSRIHLMTISITLISTVLGTDMRRLANGNQAPRADFAHLQKYYDESRKYWIAGMDLDLKRSENQEIVNSINSVFHDSESFKPTDIFAQWDLCWLAYRMGTMMCVDQDIEEDDERRVKVFKSFTLSRGITLKNRAKEFIGSIYTQVREQIQASFFEKVEREKQQLEQGDRYKLFWAKTFFDSKYPRDCAALNFRTMALMKKKVRNGEIIMKSFYKSEYGKMSIEQSHSHLENLIKNIADGFKCPISQSRMVDPVVTVDGQMYERSEIEKWFEHGNETSPATMLPLWCKELASCKRVKTVLESIRNVQGEDESE